jgi:hypothetical protein
MPMRVVLVVMFCSLACGCSSLLPRSKESTHGPWATYRDAQLTFDKVIPGQTTDAELRDLKLHPDSNANVVILNYSDIVRRFLPNSSVTMSDLDSAVKACIDAKTGCIGYEINQKMLNKNREGDFTLDLLGFHRETETTGWKFNGLVLVKQCTEIYTLTGGQPKIQEHEENTSVLGPVQGLSQKLFGF